MFSSLFVLLPLNRFSDFCTQAMKTEITQLHAKRLFYQLLSAVFYLHSGDIVHRHLWPGAILLNNSSNLWIGSFGEVFLPFTSLLFCFWILSKDAVLRRPALCCQILQVRYRVETCTGLHRNYCIYRANRCHLISGNLLICGLPGTHLYQYFVSVLLTGNVNLTMFSCLFALLLFQKSLFDGRTKEDVLYRYSLPPLKLSTPPLPLTCLVYCEYALVGHLQRAK